MSGNYGVSTTNDQRRSMIPLSEGEHALREPVVICSRGTKQRKLEGVCTRERVTRC